MVARRSVNGCDDFRSGHSTRRDGPRVGTWRRRQLAMVEHADERNAHRVLFRAPLAQSPRDDGRRVRRDQIQRSAGGCTARLPRTLSRDTDQPDHPRLGHQGDDQDSHDLSRSPRCHHPRADRVGRSHRRRHLLRDHRRLLGRGWNVGRVVDGPRSIRDQDDRRHHSGSVRRPRGRRHGQTQGWIDSALRERRRRALGSSGQNHRQRDRGLCVDAAARAGRISLCPVVGGVVSWCGARRWRLRGTANLLRENGT